MKCTAQITTLFLTVLSLTACGSVTTNKVATTPIVVERTTKATAQETARVAVVSKIVDDIVAFEKTNIVPIRNEMDQEIMPIHTVLMAKYDTSVHQCGERGKKEILTKGEFEYCCERAKEMSETFDKFTKAFIENRLRMKAAYQAWLEKTERLNTLFKDEMARFYDGKMSIEQEDALSAQINRLYVGFNFERLPTLEDNVRQYAYARAGVIQATDNIGSDQWTATQQTQSMMFTIDVWTNAAPDPMDQLLLQMKKVGDDFH